jgi:hypothetical protein
MFVRNELTFQFKVVSTTFQPKEKFIAGTATGFFSAPDEPFFTNIFERATKEFKRRKMMRHTLTVTILQHHDRLDEPVEIEHAKGPFGVNRPSE